jgi:hypothetical protein
LAQALQALLQDPDLRAEAGTIGRHEVELHYGIDTMRDRTLAVISSFGRDSE